MKKFLPILWVLCITPSTLAQIPIDPLRRLQEIQGAYTYTGGITYTPSSLEGLDFDENGPYRFSTFNQETSAFVSGGYSFSESFGINTSIDWSYASTRENRDFLDLTRQTLKNNDSSLSGSLGLEYRVAPSSSLDPRVSLNIAYPWTISAQGQVSLVQDPVILVGSVGYSRSLQGSGENVDFGVGVGFVANEVISLSGSANYSVPTDGVNLPVTSLSFRTGYNLDPRGNQEVGVRTTLSTRGSDTRIGIGLEFGGRGVVTSPVSNLDTKTTNSSATDIPSGTPQTGVLRSQSRSAASSESASPTSTTPPATKDTLEQLSRRLAARESQLEKLQQQILDMQKQLEELKKQPR